jgi:hypothetical protein
MYALMKQETDRQIASTTTLLFGTAHVFIALTRIGTVYMQAGFLSLTACYFFLSAIKKRQLWQAVLAGFFAGLCFYSYYAARIAPLIISLTLLSLFMNKKYRTSQSIAIAFCFFISMGLVILPQLMFFVANQHSFFSRTQEVFLFSRQNSPWLQSVYGNQTMFSIFFAQLFRSINFLAGDSSGQYGYKGIVFDYITISFFFLGLFAIFQKKTFFHFFVVSFLFLTILLGQTLTIPPGFLPRFVVGLPMFFIVVGLGLQTLLKQIPVRLENTAKLIAVFCIITIVVQNLYIYFIDYPNQEFKGKTGDSNAIIARRVTLLLSKFPKPLEANFLTAPSFASTFAPIRFLLPSVKKSDMSNFVSLPGMENRQSNRIFVLLPIYEQDLQLLRDTYKDGTLYYLYDADGKTLAVAYWTQNK